MISTDNRETLDSIIAIIPSDLELCLLRQGVGNTYALADFPDIEFECDMDNEAAVSNLDTQLHILLADKILENISDGTELDFGTIILQDTIAEEIDCEVFGINADQLAQELLERAEDFLCEDDVDDDDAYGEDADYED